MTKNLGTLNEVTSFFSRRTIYLICRWLWFPEGYYSCSFGQYGELKNPAIFAGFFIAIDSYQYNPWQLSV